MIYLASTSPRRKLLLKKAGISFRMLKPSYRENDRLSVSPYRLVRIHALGKAKSSAKKIREGIILSADTTVYLNGEIIAKPGSMKRAVRMLSKLQGKWHTVYTGVAIFKIKSGSVVKKEIFVEKTKVKLKALTPKGIKNYFKKINPLDKAGAYAIQSPHGGIVEDVKGLFSNAVGLPVEKVRQKLRKFR